MEKQATPHYPERSGERFVGFAVVERTVISGRVRPAIFELSEILAGADVVYVVRLYPVDQDRAMCAAKSVLGAEKTAKVRWMEATGGKPWPEASAEAKPETKRRETGK